MKKIGSCQLLKTVCLVILGGLLVMGLAGCDVRKNSRAYLEGKAAELERVFPTENLEDLFEEFPGGFEFGSLYRIKNENGYSYTQSLEINGNADTKNIQGVVKNLKTTDEPFYNQEILKESQFEYTDGQFKFENPEFEESDLAVDGFLMQYLTINKKMLSQLELLDKSYSWESEDGSISYQLQDHSLNHFLQEENNKKAKIIIGIHYETIHENKFQYGMRIKYDNNIKYTFGFSGYETIGKENEE
ncbi:hypothetical protein [Streptococcus thoraltensis]|uniref:hypothetical protein n=1 Tax=Streptococcus thoraltensis TaxID=55085 RepID=UPI001FD4D277|nr:hypothetical protein [Streptococcus thoraltensis]